MNARDGAGMKVRMSSTPTRLTHLCVFRRLLLLSPPFVSGLNVDHSTYDPGLRLPLVVRKNRETYA